MLEQGDLADARTRALDPHEMTRLGDLDVALLDDDEPIAGLAFAHEPRAGIDVHGLEA